MISLEYLITAIFTFKYVFRTPNKQRAWEFEFLMVMFHICRFHYCFDYIGLRFELSDREIVQQLFGKMYYICFSMMMVTLSVKRMCTVLFCFFLFLVGTSYGYYHNVQELKKGEDNFVSGIPAIFSWVSSGALLFGLMIYAMRLLDYEILKSHNLHIETK